MQMKTKHVIQGKWVDCKSAIPISEMKLIELREKAIIPPISKIESPIPIIDTSDDIFNT